MKIEPSLSNLIQGRTLPEGEAYSLFLEIFKGHIPEAAVKAILLLLGAKGESSTELSGCLKALRELEKPEKLSWPKVIDTCGTGGDAKASANISTLSAFVIAGAGAQVAKHGNRSISSKCGSSDLMEALGIRLDAPATQMKKAIRECGLGYFHAPYYHPVFSRMQPLRKKLKTRTLFNMLGPLANPYKLKYQMIGVSRAEWVPLFAEVLRKNKIQSGLVIHSRDGMDEISSEVPTQAAWVKQGRIRAEWIKPKAILHPEAKPKNLRRTLKINSIAKNKQIALAVLQNKLYGPIRDTVLINAAAGLVTLGKVKNLKEGLRRADQSLVSGRAYRVYRELKRISRQKS
ncbi:MAG: anthranilate phosphoribosyltransferase [Candidatus Omnitrophica bacterium]|nr:anthranilate phosphoribosyltransferase [Candidatus Omnitrophota bacterium]